MSAALLTLCRATTPWTARDFKREYPHEKRLGHRKRMDWIDGREFSTGQAMGSDLSAGGGSMDRDELFEDMGSWDYY